MDRRGDDGNEYDFYSAMPGLVYFAEMGYTHEPNVSDNTLSAQFLGIFGGRWEDWIYASKMDTLIDVPQDDKTHFPVSVGLLSTLAQHDKMAIMARYPV
jgi:hypothetical protein